ncbi:MAG: DNA mismatch repair endonuclease MutL [Chloroflexi bacterium]|nr:DNA mismatch repair endonuclease MutL [Chloroflexota bacterium]MCI0867850.1 DNA mismatch repair endonuclease MutL [Chloroflexota bacterium]
MPIQVLPPELASKIAAGEVVERPASVVKELLENALDAGASQLTVEIKGGGVEYIRVTDDGAGIPADELELAFQRHATSKLQSQDQLDAVATLGFRGEALPSIAAVSHLVMTTRPAQSDAAHQIELQWGKKIRTGPQGAPAGTSIGVSDLFGNLPARRKFLRSASTEAGRVQELVARYALAYPDVRFQLVSDGRRQFTTSGNHQSRETLLAVYGPEVANGMLEISGQDPETGYQVEGYVSAPSLNRANRTYMTFFVNRRWIQNRMLSFALEEAYHGLLPDKRFPLAVVNLSLPYADVDVNSHPAKREVRFHQESKVFSVLQRTVRAALVADSPVPQIPAPGTGAPAVGPVSAYSPSFFSRTAFSGSASEAWGGPPDAAAPKQAPPGLKVVGQLKLTYIVAEGPDGMYLVDQHAAHERILFDELRAKGEANSGARPGERLLEPVTLELTPGQVEVYQSNAQALANYGFEVEPFGPASYLLRAVPSIVSTQDPAQSLLNILDMVAFEGLVRQQEDVLAASIACHGAIRAGKSLTEAEMRALMEQLEATDNPHTCPHGRPTMLHFSSFHMEREFGRR